MEIKLALVFFPLIFCSCSLRDFEGPRTKSPSGTYELKATVNRTNRNDDNYADVIIHLYNEDNVEIFEANTGAGDSSKWSIGWSTIGDTIILHSSDIGNKAWTIENNRMKQIKITEQLNERADILKSNKYKK